MMLLFGYKPTNRAFFRREVEEIEFEVEYINFCFGKLRSVSSFMNLEKAQEKGGNRV